MVSFLFLFCKWEFILHSSFRIQSVISGFHINRQLSGIYRGWLTKLRCLTSCCSYRECGCTVVIDKWVLSPLRSCLELEVVSFVLHCRMTCFEELSRYALCRCPVLISAVEVGITEIGFLPADFAQMFMTTKSAEFFIEQMSPLSI